MTTQAKLVAAGVWPETARHEAIGDFVGGISTATSGNNVVAGAIPITGDLNYVSTSGAATNSMILTNQGAAKIVLFNSTANALNVFPPTGGTINAGAANASTAVAAGKACTFYTADGIAWIAQVGA